MHPAMYLTCKLPVHGQLLLGSLPIQHYGGKVLRSISTWDSRLYCSPKALETEMWVTGMMGVACRSMARGVIRHDLVDVEFNARGM